MSKPYYACPCCEGRGNHGVYLDEYYYPDTGESFVVYEPCTPCDGFGYFLEDEKEELARARKKENQDACEGKSEW